MRLIVMAGRQMGCVGLLTAKALGHDILHVISYSGDVTQVADTLDLPVSHSIREVDPTWSYDLLLSVHGKEIVRPKQLEQAHRGGINVHPYLHRYKGADPVSRAIRDHCTIGSVGAHIMTSEVDGGRVLAEEFTNVPMVEGTSHEDVYMKLLPLYPLVIARALGHAAVRI